MQTKKLNLLVMLLFMAALTGLYAQPQGINYQSVARNASGQILTNQTIGLRVTIHDTGPTGTAIYSERHVVTTNAFGTFGVVIGGGSIITGTLGNIAWGSAAKYMQIEMDFNGGTSYTDMGTAQLMSVPYSLYSALSAGDVSTLKFDTAGVINATTQAGTSIITTRGSWLTGGNSNLNITNNFIGTIDNIDMIIKRGGKEGIRFTTGGAMLATGDTATGVTPASGAGKRMMWIPAKGAFRAGTVNGTQWDNANIGYGSQAIGNDVLASGIGSVAIGNSSKAIGNYSQAIGTGLLSKAANSTVIGSYNDTTGSGSGAGTSDVLFQVGNGTSASSRGNAFTVNKAGQVTAAQFVSKTLSMNDTVVSVGSSAFTLPVNYGLIIINAGSGSSNTRMTLQPGRIGQMVIIEVNGGGSGGHNVIAMDDPAYHTNLAGSGVDYTMTDGNMLTLLYDGTNWVELSRSNN